MKIKLSNGTILDVESVDASCIAVIMADLKEIVTYVDAFTKENLSLVESEYVSFKDKYLASFDATPIEGDINYIICFRLKDVYTIEEKIAMLETENIKLNNTLNTLLGIK